MTNIYDITVPAQIGMKSFVGECERLRTTLASVGIGGYVEFPPCKRVFLTPTGQRVEHAVYVFRVELSEARWPEVIDTLQKEFYGKAPYSIAAFTATTAHIGADPAQGSLL